MKNRRTVNAGWWAAALLLWSMAAAQGAVSLRLVEDRVYLKADGASLREVLLAFAQYDVAVRADPALDRTLTCRFDGDPAEKVLRTLFAGWGYVIYWNELKGPPGTLIRLSGIDLYQPGRAGQTASVAGGPVLSLVRPADGSQPFVAGEILIGFKPGTKLADLRRLINESGGTVIDSLPGIGIYRLRFGSSINIAEFARFLASNPNIAIAEPNYAFSPDHLKPYAGGTLPAAALPVVPAELNDGVPRLAILDSGWVGTEGLSGLVAGYYDAVDPGTPPSDADGHGTHMALIASGAVVPAQGTEGDLMSVLSVRSMNDTGYATSWSLMAGMEYAVQNGARVINLSWGSATDSSMISAAVNYVQSQNLVVVASAGNEPTGQPVYPAAYPGVVAVSATARDGQLWAESNYGTFVDTAAPGTAQFPEGAGTAGSFAGTSIASAYTARAFSQYFAAHPEAGATQAMDAFRTALTDAGPQGYDPGYGYGVLDEAALQRFLAIPPSSSSP